jgi:purine catabolism regulator
VPTLVQIWRDVLPTATRASSRAARSPASQSVGAVPPDPEIGWVRVLRARVPALEGLEVGDLAIVPESALAALVAGGADPSALVTEMAQAGVAALLLLGPAAPGSSTADLAQAACARGLPALQLESGDPRALERSIVGYLVNRRAELDRRAEEVADQVERLALQGLGMDALAGAVGAGLGRAVAIEDERGVALVVHAPDGVPDAAAAAARYLAQTRLAALRVPLPGARSAGSLALLGPQPASELDRAVAGRVAPLLALEMGRQAVPPASGGAASAALPADGPPWAVIVARQIVRGEEVPLDERERRRNRLARLAPTRRLILRGDATSLEYRAVVALGPDDPRGLGVAGRFAAAVGRDVALSRPFREPGERSAAEAEARATLEAVELLPRGELAAAPPPAVAGLLAAARRTAAGAAQAPREPWATGGQPATGEPRGARAHGTVVLAERLPVYRLLGELHNLPGGARLAAAVLAPLLTGSSATRRRRLATVRAVLDHPAPAAAAQALGVHRNTLQYRVARIEALTGWQLDDPDLRLALAVAVRVVQNDQSEDAPVL